MDIQALGQLLMQRKRGDLTEDEKAKRRVELDTQKNAQARESKRLLGLLQGPQQDRTEADTQSFLQNFGNLLFFKEYLQEGNKAPVRLAFQKGEVRTFYKREFVTRKGEKNNSFKVILEGQVGLYLEMADPRSMGKKQLILIRKMLPGDPIEMGTLIENQTYVMTTQALTERVEVLTMSAQNFSVSFQKYESEKYEADLNFLKGVPIFAEWPKRNLISLQMCISKFQVPRAQIIYQEGQPSHAIFIVKKGEFGIATFSVFDSFGDKELLNQLPRQHSIVCKSTQGELIQIKSRHFFILAQENAELKFQVMTKLMVDSKKQEISNMRSNLTFTNENEMQILDNHLEDMATNIPHSSPPLTSSPQMTIAATQHRHSIATNTSTTNLNRTIASFGIDSSMRRSSSTQGFTINKLQFVPNPNTKQTTAQIYYQQKQAEKANLKSQTPSRRESYNINTQHSNNSNNITTTTDHVQLPLQHIQLNSSQTTFKRASSIVPIDKKSNATIDHKEQHEIIPIQSQVSFGKISFNHQKSPKSGLGSSSAGVTIGSPSGTNINSTKGFNLHANNVPNSSAGFFSATNTNNGNQTSSPHLSDRFEDAGQESTSIVKLPRIAGSVPYLKESSSSAIVIPHLKLGPQTTSMTTLHGVTQGDRTLQKGFAFSNNATNIINTRRSFNLQKNNTPFNQEDSTPSRQAYMMQHMVNGLPTQQFSSRPLINSISYSSYQLNI